MAPSKSGKRSAAAQAAEDAKRAKADPCMAGVLDALKQAESLPEDCRAMLSAGVAGSLGTPAAERHEHQSMLVKFIGEVIDGVQGRLQEAVDSANTEQATADEKKQELETKVEEAKARLTEEDENIANKKAALAMAVQGVTDAVEKLRAAHQAQRTGDTKMLEAAKDKQMLETTLERDIGYLKREEGFQPSQASKHVDALVPIAKRLGLDDSLLAAMPASCTKAPGDRGGFDTMVVSSLETNLRENVSRLAAELEAGYGSKEERAAMVTAAQGNADAAEERRQIASAELEATKEDQARAATAVRDAEAAVRAFIKAQGTLAQNCRDKADALRNFIDYNVECFKMLRDKAAPAGA